jgi:hypothetical protein
MSSQERLHARAATCERPLTQTGVPLGELVGVRKSYGKIVALDRVEPARGASGRARPTRSPN